MENPKENPTRIEKKIQIRKKKSNSKFQGFCCEIGNYWLDNTTQIKDTRVYTVLIVLVMCNVNN